MATRVDYQAKVRGERFEKAEEKVGWTGRPAQFRHQNHVYYHHRYQHQSPFVYGPRMSVARVPVVTSNKLSQHYGGIPEEPVITSDQAAKIYGGIVIVEHGRRKPFSWA